MTSIAGTSRFMIGEDSRWPGPARLCLLLLHGVHQWRQSLNAHFEAVPGLNRANAAGRARKNDVARKQRHVCGNETHQLKAVENELAGVRILAQLAILKQL